MVTVIPPAPKMPRSARIHSSWVSPSTATRSPGRMPREASPSATSRDRRKSSAQETSSQAPFRFCFTAVRSPRWAARSSNNSTRFWASAPLAASVSAIMEALRRSPSSSSPARWTAAPTWSPGVTRCVANSHRSILANELCSWIGPAASESLFTLGAKSLASVGQEEVHAKAGPAGTGHQASRSRAEARRPTRGEEEAPASNAPAPNVATANLPADRPPFGAPKGAPPRGARVAFDDPGPGALLFPGTSRAPVTTERHRRHRRAYLRRQFAGPSRRSEPRSLRKGRQAPITLALALSATGAHRSRSKRPGPSASR